MQAPEDVLVLSNMPAAYSLNIDNGLRRTGFPPTPAMSTYLLAIAAGHMVGTSTQVCSSHIQIFWIQWLVCLTDYERLL